MASMQMQSPCRRQFEAVARHWLCDRDAAGLFALSSGLKALVSWSKPNGIRIAHLRWSRRITLQRGKHRLEPIATRCPSCEVGRFGVWKRMEFCVGDQIDVCRVVAGDR
jgi:hypothetical protein